MPLQAFRMCVNMYIYMCIPYIHIYLYIDITRIYAYICIYMNICIHVSTAQPTLSQTNPGSDRGDAFFAAILGSSAFQWTESNYQNLHKFNLTIELFNLFHLGYTLVLFPIWVGSRYVLL